MSFRCKLQLTQDGNSLEVTLGREAGGVLSDLATFYGKFVSFDGIPDEGGIMPARKLWVYSLAKSELRLMDGGGPGVGEGGGGLKFGELASLTPSATLRRAVMTARGVEPSDGSGVGTGELKAAGLWVRFHPGPVAWRLLAYQQPGSNAWKSP